MSLRSARSFLVLLIILALLTSATVGQEPKAQELVAAKLREVEIEKRDAGNKGIFVGEPKVYDDSLLQQMLNAAQARLLSLQILDQAGIAAKLGSITGASQSISGFALLAQGPPSLGTKTTSTGATSSTVIKTGSEATTGATLPTKTTSDVQRTENAPVTNIETTSPSVSVPTVSAPAASTSLPTSLSVSAADVLNEQMQLTYEIANLRLLLEGSLNDRIIQQNKGVKPRVTLGFPITLFPDTKNKNAVAVVEVEIENAKRNLSPEEPPAITALLPREKTYNVASITDKSVSIGGGVVTSVASFAGSFLHGRKTYYVVQDQDTLALAFQAEDSKRIGFLWQFRPVLGAEYVKSGLRQTFVQIAFPSAWSSDSFGTIHVRTYWRCYDQRRNLAKGIQRGSLKEYAKTWPILNFPLVQNPKNFNVTQLEDLGNGQMLVIVGGRFLGGTYVRIGSNILREGSPGLTFEYQQIRFIAPISDLATKQVRLVARDGTESPLVLQLFPFFPPLKIKAPPTLVSRDESNTLLTVELERVYPVLHNKLPLILVIGGKVFGYSDAPIVREGNKLSVVVPTAFLLANPEVVVKALFMYENYGAHIRLSEFMLSAQIPKLSLLEQSSDAVKFLVWGNGCNLDQANVISPEGKKLVPFGTPASPYLRQISFAKDQLKSQKQLVLKMKEGLVFQIPIPSVEFADSVKHTVKPVSPVMVGTNEVIFQGEGMADLQKVVFNGNSLEITKLEDDRTVWVKGLKDAGVTAKPKAQTLEFYFKSGKTEVVVNVSTPKSGE